MRYSQPQSGPAQIDWSNPITRGLVFAFIPGIGDVTRFSKPASVYEAVAGRFGKQTRSLDTGPYPEFGPRKISGQPFSVIVAGTFATAATFTAPLISLWHSGNGGWKFGVTSTGNIGYTHFGVADYTTAVAINGFSGTIGMTGGASTSARFFKSGEFREAVAVGAINQVGGSTNYSIGSRTGTTDALSPSTVACVMHFERALTDAEHASLAANPWQVIKSSAPIYLYSTAGGATNTAINPAAASLVITGYAPTVAQSAHQTVAPGAGSIVITGYAPTITQGVTTNTSPAAGSIAITGYAPTITRTANQALSPAVGAISITGYAPTIFQGVPAEELHEYSATIMQAAEPLIAELNSVGTMNADALNQIANIR